VVSRRRARSWPARPTTWTQLARLHRDVRGALQTALARRGTPAVVMCHVSHLYPTGASQAEVGALGIAALQAVKARVDPIGIMNPGKVIA